ncbi:MAG: thioredoxin [Lachnospiraceae bacterium]|nr:thioredoxin [Lachnospiraceae bacterium]
MGSKKKKAVRVIFLLAAGIFILYGMTRGETAIVLNKAVNLCLECIGLG